MNEQKQTGCKIKDKKLTQKKQKQKKIEYCGTTLLWRTLHNRLSYMQHVIDAYEWNDLYSSSL